MRGIRGVGECIGAGRECRYSGARRGIDNIRGIGDLLGGVGVLGAIRGIRWHHGGRGCQGVFGSWQGM